MIDKPSERLGERSRMASRSPRAAVLDAVYPVPDPLDTLEQYQRAIHADLPQLTRDELLQERWRIEARLQVSTERDGGRAWLAQRLEHVRRALRV